MTRLAMPHKIALWLLGIVGGVLAVLANEVLDRSYHELRICPVSSNKMDGVLERFRETVDPVRRRLGIETIGYWTA